MIVIDASAMVEALVGRDVDDELLDILGGDVHAPHLLDIEVLSAFRGLVLGRKLAAESADGGLMDYLAMNITRHEAAPFTNIIWQLRHQFSSYDASYLALAELLEAPLYTCDAKLAGRSHGADVRVVHRGGLR